MGDDLRRLYVGRRTQTGVLDAEFGRVARGEFRCVLVDGPAGIGKTRLASEFLRSKRAQATALRARGHLFGRSTALGLWAEALDDHLRGRSVQEVRDLCGGLVDDLAGLLRSAAAVYGGWRSAVPTARLWQGLSTLLVNIARERPLILMFDDAHLGDASSWDALSYLADSLSGHAPVLVVATVRLHELAEPSAGRRTIVALEQAGYLSRLEVPRLDPSDLRDLAAGALGRSTPPPSLVDWLEQQSRGNPLFAVTVLDALVEAGTDPATPSLHSTPRPLADWIRMRLHGLDDLARETAEILGVVGRPTGISELRRLIPAAAQELEDVLAELAGTGLVSPHGDTPGAFELSHPLVQETIYEGMDAARRRAVHRRIARTLEADRPHEAALHFARSAVPGDAEAIASIVRALGRAWAQGTVPEAFEILGAVVDLIPAGSPSWLEVLDAVPLDATWTTVYNRINVDFDAGIRAFREIGRVLAASEEPEPLAVASVQLRLAGLLGWGRGEVEPTAMLLDQAASTFEQAEQAGEHSWALVARNELSWMHGLAGRYPDQAELARDTLAAARQAEDVGAELLALGSLANATCVQGLFSQAESALRDCIALAREVEDEGRLAYGLSVLGLTLGLDGRLREGLAAVEEALIVRPPLDPLPLAIRTQLASFTGDVSIMHEVGTRALNEFGGILRALPATSLSMAAVEAADLPLARRYLRTSGELLTRRFWMLSEEHERVRGLLLWADGAPAGAVSCLQRAAGTLLDNGALPYAGLLLVDLAEVALDVLDVTATRWAAERAGELAERIDRDHYRCLAALIAAADAVAESDDTRAASAAQQALDRFRNYGYKGLTACSLTLLGRALQVTDRHGAVTALRGAASLYAGNGATWRRDRALSMLEGLGKPGQRAAAAVRGPESLTARERQVAILAARGLTARDIGEELHIGKRTVETHIGNAYAKLGVRSRVELARAMAAAEEG